MLSDMILGRFIEGYDDIANGFEQHTSQCAAVSYFSFKFFSCLYNFYRFHETDKIAFIMHPCMLCARVCVWERGT